MNRERYLLRQRQPAKDAAGPTLLDTDEQDVVVASLANECTHQATLFSVRRSAEASRVSLM